MIFLLAFVLGVLTGFGCAFALIMKRAKASNDLGDSRSDFSDLSRHPFKLVNGRDNVKKNFPVI